MDDGRLDALGQTIVSALAGAALEHAVAFNQLTVRVQAEKIVEVAKYLRDDPGCRFVNFTDITLAADNIIRDGVHVHDLNATILHCLGIDHTRLTFKFQGRDYRLTDVHGRIVKDVLA